MSTEKDCERCSHINKSAMTEPCRSCGIAMLNFEPTKPLTNYDRIISKMPEEMAEKIGESIGCEVCKTMHHSESGECPCRPHQSCVDFWLDWLKQEATDAK